MKWLNSLVICLLLVGCGESSKVKPLFKAVPLRESHGDGQHAVFTIKLPLSDQSIPSYDSPIDPNTGLARVPVLGDVLRLMTQTLFNFGASLGMGRKRITINQPIPDLNTPYLKSIAVKRVFFHIENTNEEERQASNILARVFNGIRGIIRGETRLDFSFLREVSVLLRMDKTEGEITSFRPDIDEGDESEFVPADQETSIQIGSENGPESIQLLKYTRKDRKQLLRNNERGSMFIIYTKKPVDVRSFLRKDEVMAAMIKEIVIVNKSVIIELAGKEAVAERFFELMRAHEDNMERTEITKIDTCNDDICMDIKVNEQNMMPMLLKGNKLRIETNLDSERVPSKSFQIKGFVEFEVKLDVPL